MKKIIYLFIAMLTASLTYGQSFTAQQLETTINGDLSNSFSDLASKGFNYNTISNEDLISREFYADAVTVKSWQSEGVKRIEVS